ncbi:MAG: AMP-dependent synthetase, partial [Euryarchaeota archaeon]|nr:AMP-dependent synthetase [Euryarchaeota archaeon]
VVAVIQPKKNNIKDLHQNILSKCNQLLPSYKIPKHILSVEEFSLNSSHKIDQHKLKELVKKRL